MRSNNTTKIKALSTQIEKFKLELNSKERELKLIQDEFKTKQEHLKKMNLELEELKKSSSELIVSEHALLRYLERVYKLDLQKLSQEIVPLSLRATIDMLGNGEYHTDDGYSIKVHDNVVVTILDDKTEQTDSFKNKLKNKKEYEPTIKDELKSMEQ